MSLHLSKSLVTAPAGPGPRQSSLQVKPMLGSKEQHLKNRSILFQGLQVACGILLANAVVLPLLGEMEFDRGLRVGIIGSALALLLYVGMALMRPEHSRSKRPSGK